MKSTKEILLETAAEMFSSYGFDGVSTRDLAKKSGVNLGSINYYFGTKQKLYEAVVDNVSEFILNNFVVAIQQEVAEKEIPLSPRDEIKYILCRFLTFMRSENILKVKIELLFRELFNPSTSYEYFYKVVFEPLHMHLSRLIALDTGMAEEGHKTILLAHTLFGQIIIFKIHKEAMLRRIKIKEISSEVAQEIQELIEQNCDAILDKAMEK